MAHWARARTLISRWQSDLSVSHEKIGQIRLAQGDLDETLREFRLALAVRQMLAGKDTSNAGWQRDLAAIHVDIASAMIDRGDAERGVGEYRTALAILEPLVERAPANAALQKDLQSAREKMEQAQKATATGREPR